jgi:hypothetical protein
MNKYFYLALVLTTSCTTREQLRHETASRQEAQKLEENLNVGMSFEEVQKLSPKASDCRGSAKSFMECKISFMAHAGRYLPLKQQVGTSDIYETYILNFEKNKLMRWKKDTEPFAR